MVNYNWKKSGDDDTSATTTGTNTPVAPGATGVTQGTEGAPAVQVQPRPPGTPPTTTPSNEWIAGGNLLPTAGPRAGFDKSIGENLAVLGQGFGDIGHGIYNYTRSGGNYLTGGGIDYALGKANELLPAGTPDALRPNPQASQERYTQQARGEMGPFMDWMSYLHGLRGYNRLAGSAVDPIVGQSLVNPALQIGTYETGKSFFSGDDPKTIALKGTEGALGGGTLGFAANKFLSPLIQSFATKYWGGSTPEDIAAKAGQATSDAEQKAAQQAADAQAAAADTTKTAQAASAAKIAAAQQQAAAQQAAADQTLNELRFNRKDLGFQFEKTSPNPTYGELQAELENLKTIHPSQDPSGVGSVLQQRIQNAFQGPQAAEAQAANAAAKARAAVQAGTAQQQAQAEAAAAQQQAEAQAARTATQAQDPAIAARAKQAYAEWLAQAARTAGKPGANVPAQATSMLQQPGLTPTQIKAFSDISESGVPGRGTELLRQMGRVLGGSLGYGGMVQAGLPEAAPYTMMAGQELGADMLSKLSGSTGTNAIKNAVARQWGPLVGEYPAAARGQMTANDAIRLFYGLK